MQFYTVKPILSHLIPIGVTHMGKVNYFGHFNALEARVNLDYSVVPPFSPPLCLVFSLHHLVAFFLL